MRKGGGAMKEWDYADIVNLPHHQSDRRAHMSVYDRAAQFAPFAALTGYGQMVQDTADTLLSEQRVLLSEDEKSILDCRFQALLENLSSQPEITVLYFDESAKKQRYVSHCGRVKKIEEYPHRIVFADGKRIGTENIIQMKGEIFEGC